MKVTTHDMHFPLRSKSLCIAASLTLAGPAAVAQTTDSTAATTPASASQIVTRNTFRELAAKASPAVVHIRIRSGVNTTKDGAARLTLPPGMVLPDDMRDSLEKMLEQRLPNMTPGDQEALGFARSGSGVILTSDGYIVTSNHIVAGTRAEDIVVNMPDGQVFENVKLVGTDEMTDLAVLKVEAKKLPTLTWGDSDRVQVGDHVMAIGNPLEFSGSVSEGIVSAKHRTINKALIEDLIQTTAMINPGNSGGALVDLDGNLVGINMAIATRTGLWAGLGFAIPSKTARQVADQLITRGRVGRGYLGIEMAPLTLGLASQLGYKGKFGVVIRDVRPGSAADKAGLERYDIMSKVDGKELKELTDVHRSIGTRNPGDSVELQVWREVDGQLEEKNLKVKLDERPSTEELANVTPPPPMPGKTPAATNPTLGMNLKPADKSVGLVVEGVIPASRADRAGIMPNDIILEINRQKATEAADAQKAIAAQKSDNHLLYLEREGRPILITIPPPRNGETSDSTDLN
jgi:serine protease Do